MFDAVVMRLPEQLLAAIQQRILQPATLDHLIAREEELRLRWAEIRRELAVKTLEVLKKELADRGWRRSKVFEAIETVADIDSFTGRLRDFGNGDQAPSKLSSLPIGLHLDQSVADGA
jgi:hypothetical protein